MSAFFVLIIQAALAQSDFSRQKILTEAPFPSDAGSSKTALTPKETTEFQNELLNPV